MTVKPSSMPATPRVDSRYTKLEFLGPQGSPIKKQKHNPGLTSKSVSKLKKRHLDDQEPISVAPTPKVVEPISSASTTVAPTPNHLYISSASTTASQTPINEATSLLGIKKQLEFIEAKKQLESQRFKDRQQTFDEKEEVPIINATQTKDERIGRFIDEEEPIRIQPRRNLQTQLTSQTTTQSQNKSQTRQIPTQTKDEGLGNFIYDDDYFDEEPRQTRSIQPRRNLQTQSTSQSQNKSQTRQIPTQTKDEGLGNFIYDDDYFDEEPRQTRSIQPRTSSTQTTQTTTQSTQTQIPDDKKTKKNMLIIVCLIFLGIGIGICYVSFNMKIGCNDDIRTYLNVVLALGTALCCMSLLLLISLVRCPCYDIPDLGSRNFYMVLLTMTGIILIIVGALIQSKVCNDDDSASARVIWGLGIPVMILPIIELILRNRD